MSIKKLRIKLTYLCGFVYFLIFQLVEATDTGERATFFEALVIGLFIFGLLYGLFSDWMYYNHLIDKGAKIEYATYQKLGTGTVIFGIYIVSSTAYNELYSGDLGMFSLFIALGIIYFLVQFLSSSFEK